VLGEAAGSQDDVVGVGCSGAGDYVTGPGLVDLDMPSVIEQGHDIGGADVVVGVAAVGVSLLFAGRGMVYDEEPRSGWSVPGWLGQKLSLAESRTYAAAGDIPVALRPASRKRRFG
jgi:hypothetical protein